MGAGSGFSSTGPNGNRSSDGKRDAGSRGKDPFAEISERILERIGREDGAVGYEELERWAEANGIGRYTLRTVLIDMVDDGILVAPEGFCEGDCDIEPPKPRKVGVKRADPRDVERMKAYLSEYWSVGLIRLFDDMARAGMKDVNEVLKEVIRLGYAELSGIGVVNAAPLRPDRK